MSLFVPQDIQGLPVHIFLFLGDLAPHTPPFRRILTPAPAATTTPLLPARLMTQAPATEGLLSVADLTNTNLHVIPLIIVPCLFDINFLLLREVNQGARKVTATPRAKIESFLILNHYSNFW